MDFDQIPQIVIRPEQFRPPASQALIDVCIGEQSPRALQQA